MTLLSVEMGKRFTTTSTFGKCAFENIFPLDKKQNKTPSFQMVHIDFLYVIVIDFSLLILLYLYSYLWEYLETRLK